VVGLQADLPELPVALPAAERVEVVEARFASRIRQPAGPKSSSARRTPPYRAGRPEPRSRWRRDRSRAADRPKARRCS